MGLSSPQHAFRLLLSSLVLLHLAIFTLAQGGGLQGAPDLSTLTGVLGAKTSAASASATSASAHSKSASSEDESQHASKATSVPTGAITSAPDLTSSSATGAITDAPSLTSSAPFTNGLAGLPSLAGVGQPSLIIPDTADAPFMQKSNLPEGTVFICVGAALGFFGACVLAWHGLLAWSLHRSVKRAAAAQYMADKKVRYHPSGTYTAANMSMENLNTVNTSYKGGQAAKAANSSSYSTRKPTPNSSLFFSPTAGASANPAFPAASSSSSRPSGFLPAGFYSSGASAPVAGAVAHLAGGGPQAAGYGRLSASHSMPPQDSPSPPPSPPMHPALRQQQQQQQRRRRSSHGHARIPSAGPGATLTASASDLSLASPRPERAPSAYLEDLFQNHRHSGQSSRDFF